MLMKSLIYLIAIVSVYPAFSYALIQCAAPRVPVTGFAQAFVGDKKISGAKITLLESGQTTKTDNNGRFGFCVKPGKRITLLFQKKSVWPWNDYQATQSGTFIVPKKGITGKWHEITLQVLRTATFHFLDTAISIQRGVKLDPTKCNVVTTVTGYHKTLQDDPQGEPDARIIVLKNARPFVSHPKPFYFGILAGKTLPFSSKLTRTSADGGVLIYNLEPSKALYAITARKPGMKFSVEKFLCRAGAFINLSPPHGPMVRSLQ